MTTTEMVEKCYNDLQKSLESYTDDDNEEIFIFDDNTKKVLANIIDAGNGHLLTPLLLDYLVCVSMLEPIDSFGSTLNTQLLTLNDYYEKIETLSTYICAVCDENGHEDYNNIPPSDYEKQLFELYNKTHKEIAHNELGTYFFIRTILLIILSYMLDHKIDPNLYLSYAEPYINNWIKKLDEIGIQVKIKQDKSFYFVDNANQIIDYVIGQLDNHKREIR